MENKKRIILITVVVLILIMGFVLIAGKLIKPVPQNAQPITTTNVTTQEKPTVTAKDEKETLPTVEMGNTIGEVQSITSDSLTIKTEEGKILVLAIKGAFNVFAFTQNGSEQKKISDVKIGSKVSVQYNKNNVVMSMYLMK